MVKVKKTLILLMNRWHAEMPKFWKKILKICLTIGGSAMALIMADNTFDLQGTYNVSPHIFTVAGYVLAMAFALGFGAKLTKK